MLWAHPIEAGALWITLPVEEGTGGGVVTSGLVDKAPQWGRAPVDLRVRSGDSALADYRFPNSPGLRGISFEIPAGAGELTFEISASDAGRRHFCLDAVFSE